MRTIIPACSSQGGGVVRSHPDNPGSDRTLPTSYTAILLHCLLATLLFCFILLYCYTAYQLRCYSALLYTVLCSGYTLLDTRQTVQVYIAMLCFALTSDYHTICLATQHSL